MAEGAPLLREYTFYRVSRVRIPLSPPTPRRPIGSRCASRQRPPQHSAGGVAERGVRLTVAVRNRPRGHGRGRVTVRRPSARAAVSGRVRRGQAGCYRTLLRMPRGRRSGHPTGPRGQAGTTDAPTGRVSDAEGRRVRSIVARNGGEGGIRTLDTAEPYTGFRIRRIRPLCHLSARDVVCRRAVANRAEYSGHRRCPCTIGGAGTARVTAVRRAFS